MTEAVMIMININFNSLEAKSADLEFTDSLQFARTLLNMSKSKVYFL